MNLSLASKCFLLSLVSIGVIAVDLNGVQAQEEKIQPEEVPLVEVEPTNILPVDVAGEFQMVPYRFRRKPWGTLMGVSYSTFEPINHTSDQYQASFSDVYGQGPGMIEINVNIKRNFSFGSLGIDMGVGFFSASSSADYDARIQLMPARLGGKFTLDNLYPEPYVAPYVAGGIYSIVYTESVSTASVNGNTQVSFYGTAGALVQLNWIDKAAARDSYQESGIENTFLVVEARYFMESQAARDFDFSSLHYNVGIQLEF